MGFIRRVDKVNCRAVDKMDLRFGFERQPFVRRLDEGSERLFLFYLSMV